MPRTSTVLCAAVVYATLAPWANARAQDRPLGPAAVAPPAPGGLLDGTRAGGVPRPEVLVAPLGDPEMLKDPREAADPGPDPRPGPGPELETPVDPATYVCGRGDTLELNVWGRQNLKQRLVIDSEGRVFLPRIGYFKLAGKTLAAARSLIRGAMHRYYPGLAVDVALAAPRTFLVHVVGGVARPGLYEASPVVRVGTLIDRAGAKASRRHIEVLHRDGTVAAADLVRYEQEGDLSKNPVLMDGDVVRVPLEQVTVGASGAVRRPGRFELVDGKDLAELMKLAGGLRADASRRMPIRILRRGPKELGAVLTVPVPPDGQSFPAMELKDGDEVRVESAETLQPSVLVVGAVARAAADAAAPAGDGELPKGSRRVPVAEGDTVRAVIALVGGVLPEADLSAAYLDRVTDGKVEHRPIDLEALLVRRDLRADQPVQMGDVIVVPQKRRDVFVSGAVTRPGPVPFNPRFALDEYLSAAGGLTREARSKDEVQLLRADGKTLAYGRGVTVSPGDTIVVPQRNYSRAEVASLALGAVGVAATIASIILVTAR